MFTPIKTEPAIKSATDVTSTPRERKFTTAFLPEEIAVVKEKRLTSYWQFDRQDSDIPDIFESKHRIYEHKLRKFCTGSKYIGKWNDLGPAVKGIYRYPHGVIYDGNFNKNGEFHGPGALIYPNGHRVDALWNNGRLFSEPVVASAKEELLSTDYCTMPDRRFQIEIEHEFKPAPLEYLTNSPNPPPKIPFGFYYTDEGYYGAEYKAILSFEESLDLTHSKMRFDGPDIDSPKREKLYEICDNSPSDDALYDSLKTCAYEQKMNISGIPSKKKEKWIIKNCRRAADYQTGYRPDLYEGWITGSRSEEEKLAEKLSRKRSSDTHMFDDTSESTFELPTGTNFIQKPTSFGNLVAKLNKLSNWKSKPQDNIETVNKAKEYSSVQVVSQ